MEISFGTPAQFAGFRELLIQAEFKEASICQRCGKSNLQDAEAAVEENREAADGLDVLIRLLLHGLPVDPAAAGKLLDPALLAALEHFGLIASSGPAYHGTAMLHPWGSLYVASDSVRAARNGLPSDFVFPVLTPQTGRFLASLPDEPCGDLLDLCSGSGIAALIAAEYSDRVWACDVTRRATQFAEFNRRLNNLPNLTALEGDLYQPVAGLTFDRIVANPPYVPSLKPAPVYKDGGLDGEQITRRIVESLSTHLRPGGRLYCTTMFSDRRQARLEQRLRAMLGESADEFDLFIFRRQALTPLEYRLRLSSLGQAALVDAQQWLERFQQLEVERLVTCSFVAQRREKPRGVITVSRQVIPGTGSKEMEWLRRVETAATEPGYAERLMGERPAVSTNARLVSQSELKNGHWTITECSLETGAPFPLRLKCPPWTTMLLGRCDGKRSLWEHFQILRDAGAFPREETVERFAGFVRTLVSAGILEISTRVEMPAGSDEGCDVRS